MWIGRYAAYHNGGSSYGIGQFANGWQDLASGVVPQPADDFVDMEFRVAGGDITLLANGTMAAKLKAPAVQDSYGISVDTLNGLSLFKEVKVRELDGVPAATAKSAGQSLSAAATTAGPETANRTGGLAAFGYRLLLSSDSLEGWKGEPGIWTLTNGIITGALPKTDNADHLLFCSEAVPADFSLRFEFMVDGPVGSYANGGIRYRMSENSVLGYQLDVGSTEGPDGKNYEHGGRAFLSHAGRTVRVRRGSGGTPALEDLAETCYADAMKTAWDHAGWHHAEIIARGNRLTHTVDGVMVADIIDDDVAARHLTGSRLALKYWTGNRPVPAKVHFRNLQLRPLPSTADLTVKTAVDLLTPELELFSAVRKQGPGDFRVQPVPSPMFRLDRGVLQVSGESGAMLVTRAAYANYILRGQFRWGEATYGNAASKPRNSGLWVHTHGPNEGSGYECQIRETDTGSLYGFPGTLFSVNGQAKRAPFQRFGRLGGRPDGQTKGERPPDEIERPHGEWNDYEVVCRGDALTIRVNGITTSEAVGLNPAQGHIAVECSSAEIQFRNLRLLPLDAVEADAAAGSSARFAFRDDGQGNFVFDTGVVSGRIQKDGLGEGLQSVVLKEGNVRVDSDNHGLLIPYRFLTPQKRYGFGSWEWPRTGRLLPDGGIELRWAGAADRPFSFTYTFRWPTADTLDTTLVFQSDADLDQFELFLGSYFRNFNRCAVYVPDAGDGRPGFLEAAKDQGGMQLFPRSEDVLTLVRDGRWKFPPYPNDWSLRPSFAFPLGLRQEPKSGATVLMLAPPQDCFALSMSQQESGLGAYYLSLFGRDARRGQALTAHVRLVFGRGIAAEQAVTKYREFLRELGLPQQ
jgi:hypothetical protein